MPGPLSNTRHELFCQYLLQGFSREAAYLEVGFTSPNGNSCRVFNRPDVQERLLELKGAAAEIAVTTAHDIALQLDEDRQFARGLDAPAAAISATMGKAKVLGLLSEKVEHSGPDGGPIEIADADLARLIAFQLTKAARQS